VHLVDIDKPQTIDPSFLAADTLIINITSKNAEGYTRLISAIENSPVQRVLFVSSSSVYQNLNREVGEDEGAENAESPLFQIEQLFRQSPAFQTTVVRFSGLVGPGRHPGRFFRGGKTIKQVDAPINLIHFDDCIGIIRAIIEQDCWGEVFNGCSDSHPPKREFYGYASELAGREFPALAEPTPPAYKIVTNTKVKQRLGYQFQHPDLMQLAQEHYE
jgi:nucleoside-diphosphate-sugar epimerase